MTSIIIVFVLATILGLIFLIVPILAYYWGERGKPPPTGEEKKRLREEELQLRAEQIERSKNTKITPRNKSFWDNRKT